MQQTMTTLAIGYLKWSNEDKYVIPGSVSDQSMPEIHGTAKPGLPVSLYNGNTLLATLQADAQGLWHYQPSTEQLFSGDVSLRVEQQGNTSPAFNYSVNANAAPRLTIDAIYSDVNGDAPQIPPGISKGTITQDSTPTIVLSATPNTTVSLFDNGKHIADIAVDESGYANYTFEQPLTQGEHSFTVSSAGQTAETAGWKITVAGSESGNVIPSVPVTIDNWALDNVGGNSYFQKGGKTDDSRPTFEGRAGANELVTLYDQNGRALGSTRANSMGSWKLELTQELQDGNNTIIAKTASQQSDGFSMSLQTAASVPVTINSWALDNVGGNSYFQKGGKTDDSRPTFDGRAGANEWVTLYDQNGRALGSTRADSTGNWKLELTQELQDGNNTIIAKTASQQSDGFSMSLQTAASVPVTINSWALDNVGGNSYFQKGGKTDDSRPTFDGRAGANEWVTLYDQNGRALGSTRADSTGNWKLELTQELQDGNNTIIAKTASQQSDGFSMSLQTAASVPVTINSWALDNVGGNSYFQKGGKTDDSRPTFDGRAGANEWVTLYDQNGRALGSTRANSTGSWKLELTQELQEGNNTIIAKTASQQSDGFSVTLQTATPVPVTIDSWALDNVNGNSYILKGQTTDDSRPQFSGTAGANELVTLYDQNGRALGSTRANSTGSWKLELTQELQEGNNTIIAKTASQQSDGFSVTLQTATPVPVTIDSWALDNVNGNSYILKGQTTDDSRPQFSGTAGANELVTLYDQNGRALGSTRANSNGSWRLELTQDLQEGNNTVIAKTAGQESGSFNLILETISPTVPVTLANWALDNVGGNSYVYSDQETDDSRPQFSGTAGANEIVTLYDQTGRSLGSTQANSSGAWFLQLTQDLREGSNTVVAKTATQVSESFEITYKAFVAPALTIDNEYFDNVGKTGMFTAGEGTTDDTRPRLSGNAAPLQIVELYDQDGRLLGKTVAFTSGKWQMEITQDLHEGVNTIYARSGNEVTETISITVDTHIPQPLTIDPTVYDNVGFAREFTNGQLLPTDDNRPTFSGSAQAGEQVSLFDAQNRFLGSAVADASGRWEVELENALNNGVNMITAKTATETSNTFILNVNAPVSSRMLDIDTLLQDGGEILPARSDVSEPTQESYQLTADQWSAPVTTDGVANTSLSQPFEHKEDVINLTDL